MLGWVVLFSRQCVVTGVQVKVMSFNLRTSLARDPCPSGCWEQRKWRVQQLLQRYSPDLIGTQEGAPDQIQFLQSNVGYASVGECAGPCESNERNAIFYRADRWQVIEQGTFALSDTPDLIPSNTWSLQYLRAAVWARFQASSAPSKTVCMLNTHYDVSHGQEKSSLLVADRLAQYCQRSDMVVMTGDLNTQPFTPAVKYLLGEMPLENRNSPFPLYETLTAAGAGSPTWVGSFSTATTDTKFDYIFARNDSSTCITNASVILDTFDGFTCSDHAVVQAELCLGQGCERDHRCYHR
ncbi:TPA: hypothetical protein N0F65_010814 [Lagenidium giganteum]|uniref:Endonuclease/exonuclease/phosphatase domain-containing protein n=1 Tax=Lagenidium giganteum TaxID=4803 RepID=A0AAV2Z3I4_9STRA|nr:TPA: hypothetical protein N0F65_010814 [Lagenidium giganteum]